MFGKRGAESLERLVYCSRACIDTTSLQAISELLGEAQRNNAREGLTGALAVNDGWFLQVIEGPAPALDGLLRRLDADARHTDLTILSRRPVSGRLFRDWSMVAARVTPDVGPQLQRLIDDCRVSPEAAVDALLRIVVERKAETAAGTR
ncbi:BLUF domain-containing protein [Brevundimonas sp.]|uniref:BLUF domain-containing protein n=1 Tax=Brevundimonas sp. TaxID=1871086 RepID=UPI002D66E861|nr:BLUF domain-containing protein [Brevundimonas sp.]HYD28290.1 BLUF domain-containing protein [Brevundimonas sp.]